MDGLLPVTSHVVVVVVVDEVVINVVEALFDELAGEAGGDDIFKQYLFHAEIFFSTLRLF